MHRNLKIKQFSEILRTRRVEPEFFMGKKELAENFAADEALELLPDLLKFEKLSAKKRDNQSAAYLIFLDVYGKLNFQKTKIPPEVAEECFEFLAGDIDDVGRYPEWSYETHINKANLIIRGLKDELSFPRRTGPLHLPRMGDVRWLGNDIRTKTS